MKVTQFKNMLAIHGADISRWDGAPVEEARELIRTSAEARALYKEAGALDDALDSFAAGAPDPALLDRVMRRIDGPDARPAPVAVAEEDIESAGMPPFLAARSRLYRGGAIACALVVLLAAGWLGEHRSERPVAVAQNNSASAQKTRVAAADIDSFLAELDNTVREDVTEQEMIGLLAMADTAPEAPPLAADEDIDAFLDRLFSDMENDPELRQEMNTWGMVFDQQL